MVPVKKMQGTKNSEQNHSIDIIPVYKKMLQATVKKQHREHLKNINGFERRNYQLSRIWTTGI